MCLSELLRKGAERRDVFDDVIKAFLQPRKPRILVSSQRACLARDSLRLLLQIHHHFTQAIQLGLEARRVSLGRSLVGLQGRHPVRELDDRLVTHVGRPEGSDVQGPQFVVHCGLPALHLLQLPVQIRRMQRDRLHPLLCILHLQVRGPARAFLFEIVHPQHTLPPHLLPHLALQLLICPRSGGCQYGGRIPRIKGLIQDLVHSK
mmetsp:Transcript_48229/g.104932  ORF Transcript_48229/g.104932 Transcript_48229/m.104932 type:complete len:205 (+) Transcript_48229:428-1042(+)